MIPWSLAEEPDNPGFVTVQRMFAWSRLEDRSARGIAAFVGRAIRDGTLPVGTRLAPVRAIARELGVSPTTVSDAWRELARNGAIESHGRNGTYVRLPDPVLAPRRYRQVTDGRAEFELDLSTGTPDPALLPPLAPALARAATRGDLTTSYADDPVLPELGDILREDWPFPPESFAVFDGAMDALDRVLRETVRIGDRVVVEDPTFPPLLDLLDVLGAVVVPVGVDECGLRPDEFATALRDADPVAVIVQPRAQNPSGAAFDPERVDALARLLRSSPRTLVVEDDHAGAIASEPRLSLGAHLVDRTVTILGFSKSHGPDLRLAAIGGASGPIDAAATRRQLGPGWSSRLLQAALAELLVDAHASDQVATARSRYARRRLHLVDGLRKRGLAVSGRDGINVWVPVDDEQHALVALAARGIAVAPGTPFRVVDPRHHIRVTVASLSDSAADVVDAIDRAARRPDAVRRA